MKKKILTSDVFFQVKVKKSKIHGTGLFAAENIPANKNVMEYTGEKITNEEGDKRILKQEISGCVYVFSLDDNYCIDANVGGGLAKYANHSCDPNLGIKRKYGRIFLYSRRKIKDKEELVFDYAFDKNEEKETCHCQSPKCRGFINEV